MIKQLVVATLAFASIVGVAAAAPSRQPDVLVPRHVTAKHMDKFQALAPSREIPSPTAIPDSPSDPNDYHLGYFRNL